MRKIKEVLASLARTREIVETKKREAMERAQIHFEQTLTLLRQNNQTIAQTIGLSVEHQNDLTFVLQNISNVDIIRHAQYRHSKNSVDISLFSVCTLKVLFDGVIAPANILLDIQLRYYYKELVPFSALTFSFESKIVTPNETKATDWQIDCIVLTTIPLPQLKVLGKLGSHEDTLWNTDHTGAPHNLTLAKRVNNTLFKNTHYLIGNLRHERDYVFAASREFMNAVDII